MTDVNVPSYIIDRNGVVAWLNPAAESIVGDVRGQRFTDVVTPEDRPRAKEAFARKILGKEKVTDAEVELVGADGREVSVEVSSVPLKEGHQIVGVFGPSRPPAPPKSPRPHAKLTPRQHEVLGLLAHGSSTHQIAELLHLSRETVRNHIRGSCRRWKSISRVEAVATARAEGPRRLTQLGQAPSRADLQHLAAVSHLKLSTCGRRASHAGDPHPLVCGSPPRRGPWPQGAPAEDPPSRRAPAPCPVGHDPDVGAGRLPALGYVSRASSSETEPAMITSSPCCQLAGVATLCFAVSWSESITRSTSSKLRPVVIG